MTTWITTHGAAAIQTRGSSFDVKAYEGGAELRPTAANQLEGSVLFPLPSLPQNASHLTAVAVKFSSQTARVVTVALMSGGDELFSKKGLRKTMEFTIPVLRDNAVDQEWSGLALVVAVQFETVTAELDFQSVGVGVALAPPATLETVRFDNGTWNVTDVRPWDRPRERTEARIDFRVPFTSVPTVTAGMTGGDVSGRTNFRVKVYATNIDARGFTVHADTWEDTKLYSCGVSWVAIGH